MHTRFIRGVNVIVALSLVAAGCGVTGLSPVASLCAAALFNVHVILGTGPGGVVSGQPAAGVNVILQPAGGAAQSQTTDASGCASFSTPPPGVYDVSAVPPAQLLAAARTVRDLNVASTGREILLVLSHRNTVTVPGRPAAPGPFTGMITGTLRTETGAPQPGSGDGDAIGEPGEMGFVTFQGLFTDITDAAGAFSVARTGLSSDRPAVTGSLFGGNWDGVGVNASAVLGITHEYITRYAYSSAVNLVGSAPVPVGNFDMQLVTGSQPTSLDAQGASFVSALDSPPVRGLSITDLFLYNSIHSADLWLATVYHDSGITSVTTPIPQITLDQGVYWYGFGVAGQFDPAAGFVDVFGVTTTFLVSGASALNISYLPRPGDPEIGSGAAPTISWTASAGAIIYQVDITDSVGNLVWRGFTSPSLSATVPMSLASGSYSVQVFANDSTDLTELVTGGERVTGGGRTVRSQRSFQATGLVPRTTAFRIKGRTRKELASGLQALARNWRPGGPMHRPFLDRTPFSNNDDRISWSSIVGFSR